MSQATRGSSSSRLIPSDGKTLPPIRELFHAELGRSPSSLHSHPRFAQQPYGSSGYPLIKTESDPNEPGIPPRSDTRHSSQHFRPPPVKQEGRRHTADYEGHLYGVLRTSAASGSLTDAIPPSTRPQGIIRQNSTSTSHEIDDPSKRHLCEHCGKRFAMPSHYQIHLRSHTSERPFVCDYQGCGRAFTVKGNLTRHLRTHEKSDSGHGP